MLTSGLWTLTSIFFLLAPVAAKLLSLAIRRGNWKYLDHKGSGGNGYEKGNIAQYALPEKEPSAPGQLYNLKTDPGETTNLYFKEVAKREELQTLLARLKATGRSALKGRTPLRR